MNLFSDYIFFSKLCIRRSEHTINGEEFPMEMHIVHKKVGLTVEEALSTSDGLAVVGQMFQVAQL